MQNGRSPNAPLVDILNNKDDVALNADHDLTGFEDELGEDAVATGRPTAVEEATRIRYKLADTLELLPMNNAANVEFFVKEFLGTKDEDIAAAGSLYVYWADVVGDDGKKEKQSITDPSAKKRKVPFPSGHSLLHIFVYFLDLHRAPSLR